MVCATLKRIAQVGIGLVWAAALVLQAAPLAAQDDSGLIDDFESSESDDLWWSFADGGYGDCAPQASGYQSDRALRITFDLGEAEYAGCGLDVGDPARWVGTAALGFVWRADDPNLTVLVELGIADPTQPDPDMDGVTPFEVVLPVPMTDWHEVVLAWDEFERAEWVEGGTETLDLARAVTLTFVLDELQTGTIWIDDVRLAGGAASAPGGFDAFALWTSPTQLRGANIWQRVVVPEIDGDEFLGNARVGPPYVQEDFDRMAALGANYVNISGPGLFTETAPYVLDPDIEANLDRLLEMIATADMFAVISFRTGPGRSDFTFYDDGIEEWGDPALVIEHVWTEQAAQDAWSAMWRYTAERYRDNPVVVGYDLMVEPNAAGRLLDIWDPEDFYPDYAGTLYDWNQFYPRLIDAIREVDVDTPVLVSCMGWGAVRWLSALKPVDDPRVVYMVHQYEPQDDYTHQPYPAANTYPGEFDLDWDGVPDSFDRAWLDEYLSTIDAFQAQYGVPVAVNEYGLVRWIPGAAEFMRDQMALFEARGMNHAFWMFSPAWPPHAAENDDFDFLHGPDPNQHANVETSDLIEVVLENWSQNTLRPSTVGQ